jgi:hypothetical protein
MKKNNRTRRGAQEAKSFRLWHVRGRGEFIAIVAEAGTFEEIKKVRRRVDWRYQITRDGLPIDEAGFPVLSLPGEDIIPQE